MRKLIKRCAYPLDTMPTYELALLLKSMPRHDLTAALKRTATAIFEEGGVIRKMDNLGFKPMPYKISAHGKPHREAHYFVLTFDIGLNGKESILDKYRLDVDIVRSKVFYKSGLKLALQPEQPCTLHLDMLPPTERPSVQELVKLGKKREKSQFKYNSGMDYYPFQR